MRSIAFILTSLTLQSVLHSALQSAPLYTVVNLGGFGGNLSTASAVNRAGVAAGYAKTPNGTLVAFSSTGAPALLGASAQADDINANGVVVGTTYSNDGPRATAWSGGVAQEILSSWSYGLGINDSGTIAGARLSGEQLNAFVHSGGVTTDLSTPGYWSSAYDVNASGRAVGYYGLANGDFKAFSWTEGGGTTSLGTLGGRSSYAQALNDSGHIVGSSTDASGFLHAFLYAGSMRDLGTLGGTTSAAYGINSAGDAVGYSKDSNGTSRAFVWKNGTLFDLNALVDPSSGWSLEAAYGINDAGQIAGTGKYFGQTQAFRLDRTDSASQDPVLPNDPAPSEVPEPWTASLTGAGLLLVALRRVRQR